MTDLEKEYEMLRIENEELKEEIAYLHERLAEREQPKVIYKEVEKDEVTL
jgi:cell division septum initiation protein DivIVA